MQRIKIGLLLTAVTWLLLHCQFSWITPMAGLGLSGIGLWLSLHRPLLRGAVFVSSLAGLVSIYEAILWSLLRLTSTQPADDLAWLGILAVTMAWGIQKLPFPLRALLRLAPGERHWLAHLQWGLGLICSGVATQQGSDLAGGGLALAALYGLLCLSKNRGGSSAQKPSGTAREAGTDPQLTDVLQRLELQESQSQERRRQVLLSPHSRSRSEDTR